MTKNEILISPIFCLTQSLISLILLSADTETTIMTDRESAETDLGSQQSSPSVQTGAPKGIRKIFGK